MTRADHNGCPAEPADGADYFEALLVGRRGGGRRCRLAAAVRPVVERLEVRRLLTDAGPPLHDLDGVRGGLSAGLFHDVAAADGTVVRVFDAGARPLDGGGAGGAMAANVTGVDRGITGLAVGLPAGDGGAVDLGDFSFRVRSDFGDGSAWTPAPRPDGFYAEGGPGGGRTAYFAWGGAAVVDGWLEVTVAATPATGLDAAGGFYFGSAVGQARTGGPAGVTGADVAGVLAAAAEAAAGGGSPAAAGHGPNDLNLDGSVDAADAALAEDGLGGGLAGFVPAAQPVDGLSAEITGPSSVLLRWSAGAPNAAGYRVEAREDRPGAAWGTAGLAAAGGTALFLPGAFRPGGNHRVRVVTELPGGGDGGVAEVFIEMPLLPPGVDAVPELRFRVGVPASLGTVPGVPDGVPAPPWAGGPPAPVEVLADSPTSAAYAAVTGGPAGVPGGPFAGNAGGRQARSAAFAAGRLDALADPDAPPLQGRRTLLRLGPGNGNPGNGNGNPGNGNGNPGNGNGNGPGPFWEVEVTDLTRAEGTPAAGPVVEVTAGALTPTDVEVAWSGVQAGATELWVERSRDGGVSWIRVAELAPDRTAYVDRRLLPDTDYEYRIVATLPGGDRTAPGEGAAVRTPDGDAGVYSYRLTGLGPFLDLGPLPAVLVQATAVLDSLDNSLTVGAGTSGGGWHAAASPLEAAADLLEGGVEVGDVTLRPGRDLGLTLEQDGDGRLFLVLDPARTPAAAGPAVLRAEVFFEAERLRLRGEDVAVAGRPYKLRIDLPPTPDGTEIAEVTVDWGDGTSSTHAATDGDARLAVVTATHVYDAAAAGVTDRAIAAFATPLPVAADIQDGGGGGLAFQMAPDDEVGRGGVRVEPDDVGDAGDAPVDNARRREILLDQLSHVYSTVKFQPYAGAKKGAAATAQTGRGNAWDQAALLKERIEAHGRLAGVDVEYVFRVVEAPAAHVEAWLGVEGEAAAEKVLHRAGLLAEYFQTGTGPTWRVVPSNVSPADPDGRVALWHTWLRVRNVPGLPGVEWDLDPSWKYRRLREGRPDVAMTVPFDRGFYSGVNNTQKAEADLTLNDIDDRLSPLEWYEGVLMDRISTTPDLRGAVTLADLSRDGPIVARRFFHKGHDEPPVQTEYRVAANSPDYWAADPSMVMDRDDGDGPVADWTHRVAMHVRAEGLGASTGEQLSGEVFEVLSLPRDGLTPVAVGYGFRARTDRRPFPEAFIPRLWVGDARQNLGSFQLDGTTVEVRLAPIGPGGTTPATAADVASGWSESTHPVNRRHGLMLDAQQHSEASLVELQGLLNVQSEGGGDHEDRDRYVSQLLYLTGARQAADLARDADLAAGLTGTLRVVPGVELGRVTAHRKPWALWGNRSEDQPERDIGMRLQNPVVFDHAGVTLANRRALVTVDLDDRRDHVVDARPGVADAAGRIANARRLIGYTSSYLEHAALEEVLNVRSASTVKAFQRATSDSEPDNDVTPITSTSGQSWQQLFGLLGEVDEATETLARSAIADDVAAGFEVWATADVVSFADNYDGDLDDQKGWSGVAWSRYHPDGRHDFRLLSVGGEVVNGGEGVAGDAPGDVAEDAEQTSPFGSGTVNLYTGALTYAETDVTIPNPTLPLEFGRTFDSSRHYDDRGFGGGWSHTYSDHLLLFQREGREHWDRAEDEAAPRVVMTTGGGDGLTFFREEVDGQGTNNYRRPSGFYGDFRFLPPDPNDGRPAGQYVLTAKDGAYRVFEEAPLETELAVTYVAPSYRLKATGDRLGNQLLLTYYDELDPGSYPAADEGGEYWSTEGFRLALVDYAEGADVGYDGGRVSVDANGTSTGRHLWFQWYRGHVRHVADFAGRAWTYEYELTRKDPTDPETLGGGGDRWLSSLARKFEPFQVEADAGGSPIPFDTLHRGRTDYWYDEEAGWRLSLVERLMGEVEAGDTNITPDPDPIGSGSGTYLDAWRGRYEFAYYPNGRVYSITSPLRHGQDEFDDAERDREFYTYNLFSGPFGEDDEPRVHTAEAIVLARNNAAATTHYGDTGLARLIVEDDRTRVEQEWERYADPPPDTTGDDDDGPDPLLASNRVIARRDAAGLREAIYYDGDGDVVRHLTGAWHNPASSFGFYESGNSATEVDPDVAPVLNLQRPAGRYVDATHDDLGQPLTVTEQVYSPTPRVTSNEYHDDSGLLERTTDPLGNETSFGYRPNGQLQFKRLPRSSVPTGDPVPPAQFVEWYEYDDAERTFTVGDGPDAVTRTVEGAGGVTRVYRLDADGDDWDLERAEYDALGLGLPLWREDAEGRRVAYEHDALARRVAEERVGASVMQLQDARGDSDYDDPEPPQAGVKHRTQYDYDGDWLVAVRSPGSVDHAAKEVVHHYDDRGHRWKSVDVITDAETYAVFDATGNKTDSVDAMGRWTRTLFDARNRPYQTIEPDGGFRQVLLDGMGRTVEEHRPVARVQGYRLDPTAVERRSYGAVAAADAPWFLDHWPADGWTGDTHPAWLATAVMTIVDTAGRRTVARHGEFGDVRRRESYRAAADHYRLAWDYERDALGRVTAERPILDPTGGNTPDLDLGGDGEADVRLFDAAPSTFTTYDAHGNATRVERVGHADDERRVGVAAFDAFDRPVRRAADARDATLVAGGGTVLATLGYGGRDHGLAAGDRVWATGGGLAGGGAILFVDSVVDRHEVRVALPGYAAFDEIDGDVEAAQAVVDTSYYDDGRVREGVDGRGFTTTSTYDGLGRLTERSMDAPDAIPALGVPGTPSLRPVYTYHYYADGTLARELAPGTAAANGGGRAETTYRYAHGTDPNPAMGTASTRFITVDPLGRSTVEYRDHAGGVVGHKDESDRVTTHDLDAAGRVARTVRPDPDGPGGDLAPADRVEHDQAGNARASWLTDVDGVDLPRAFAAADFDASGRALRQTRYSLDEGLGQLAASAWAVQLLSSGNVRVLLSVPAAQAAGGGGAEPLAAGDVVLLQNHAWTETRRDADGRVVGVRQPDSGVHGGELFEVAHVGDPDDGVVKVAIDLSPQLHDWLEVATGGATPVLGATLDVFLPDLDPDAAPAFWRADVHRRTRLHHDDATGAVTREDARGYLTRTTVGPADRPHRQYAGREVGTMEGVGAEVVSETLYGWAGEARFETSFPDGYGGAGRTTERLRDGLGRVIEVRRHGVGGDADLVTTTGHDAAGNVMWETGPRGNALLAANGIDPLVAAGQNLYTTTHAYDGLGRRTRTATPDPDHRLAEYPDDASGNGDLEPAVTTFAHDPAGNRTRTTDPLGRVARADHDGLGRPVLEAAGGRVGDVDTADARVHLNNHGLSEGDRVWIDGGDDADGVVEVTAVVDRHRFGFAPVDPDDAFVDGGALVLPGPAETRYNPTGTVLSRTDARGGVTAFVYDGLDRVVEERAPAVPHPDSGVDHAPRTLREYDLAGAVTRVTLPGRDAPGDLGSQPNTGGGDGEYEVDREYDALGRLVAEAGPMVALAGGRARPVTRTEYDAAGNAVAVVDPRGTRSETEYDWAGRPVATRAGTGTVVGATALASDLVAMDVQVPRVPEDPAAGDPLGHGVPAGNRLQLVVGGLDGGPVLVDAVVAPGDTDYTLTVAPPEGTSGYDLADDLQDLLDAGADAWFAASASRTEHNALGDVLVETDAAGAETSFAYDGFGRLVREVLPVPGGVGPDGQPLPAPTTTRGYDADGNVRWVTGPLGNARIDSGTYDLGGSTLDAALAVSHNVGTATYEYDPLGRVTRETMADPDPQDADDVSPETKTVYDAAGQAVLAERRRDAGRWVRSASILDSLGRQVAAAADATGALAGWAEDMPDGYGPGRVRVDALAGLGDLFGGSYPARIGELVLLRVDGRPDLDGAYPIVDDLPGNATSVIVNLGIEVADLDHAATVGRAAAATTYSPAGDAVASLDPLGRGTTREFDAQGRLIREVLPEVEHAAADDPDGPLTVGTVRPTTTYRYDLDGNAIAEYGPLAHLGLAQPGGPPHEEHAVLTRHDALGRVVEAEGPMVDLDPDNDGGPGDDVDDERAAVSTAYDLGGNPLSVTDPREQETRFEHGPLGRELSSTPPVMDGQTPYVARTAYDARGNATTFTTARGDQDSAVSGDADRPVPLHRTAFAEHDALNRVVAEWGIDPDGDANGGGGPLLPTLVRRGYDAAGNAAWVLDGVGNDYLNYGDDVAWMVANHLHASVTEYDDLGRVTAEHDPSETPAEEADAPGDPDPEPPHATTFARDALGRLLSRADANGNATSYGHDRLGRVVLEEVDAGAPHGEVERTWTFDAAGNTVRHANRNGQVFAYAHDALGRPTAEVWEADGSLPTRTFARSYDAAGRLTRLSDGAYDHAYGYDRAGGLLWETRVAPGGPGVRHEHALGLAGDAHRTETFLGDGPGPALTEWRVRDAAGRLTAVRQAEPPPPQGEVDDPQCPDILIGGDGDECKDGPPEPATLFEARQANFAYDADGNRASLERWAGTVGGAGDAGFFAPGQGGLPGTSLPHAPALPGDAATRTDYAVDDAGRLGGMTHAGHAVGPDGTATPLDVADHRGDGNAGSPIARDAAGRVSGLHVAHHSSGDEGQHAYAYDPVGRLTRAEYPGGQGDLVPFGYDPEGNRDTLPAGADNRVDGWSYDAEGNLLSDGVRSYAYDQGSRLVRVGPAGSPVAAHAHDAAGRRARLTVPGGNADGTDRVEHHAHDAAGNVLLAYDGDGVVLNAHLHGPRPLEALAESRPGAAAAALGDLAASYDWGDDDPSLPAPPPGDQAQALADAAAARGLAWTLAGHDGSVRDVLDARGQPLRHLRYGPFGRVLAGAGPDADLPEANPRPRHGYTGHAQEWHTADAAGAGGLVFMNARFYDPATGRFLNQDPLGFGGGPDNLYSYAGNDPVNHVDPTGEFLFPLLAAATPYLLTAGAVATAGAGALAVAANNSDSFAGFLADMGGDLADFFGVDDFTLPLGFASVSFGRAEDGSQYFGFGGMISINGFGVGLNTLVTEDARGTRDSNVGASLGVQVTDYIGLRVGVSPGGEFSGGLDFGPEGSLVTAGPTATYGQTGFRPGVGVNAKLPITPLEMGNGYAPAIDFGGGFVYGDDSGLTPYGTVGVGFARRDTISDSLTGKRTKSHWMAATELPTYSWTKAEGQPTRTSLSWNPFSFVRRAERIIQNPYIDTTHKADLYDMGSQATQDHLRKLANNRENPQLPELTEGQKDGIEKFLQSQPEEVREMFARTPQLREGLEVQMRQTVAEVVERDKFAVLINGSGQDEQSSTVINLLREVLPSTNHYYSDGVGTDDINGSEFGTLTGLGLGTGGKGIVKDARTAVEDWANNGGRGSVHVVGYSRGAAQGMELSASLNNDPIRAGGRTIDRPDNLLLIDPVYRSTLLPPLMIARLDLLWDKNVAAHRATVYFADEDRPLYRVAFDNTRPRGNYTQREGFENHSTVGRNWRVGVDLLRNVGRTDD